MDMTEAEFLGWIAYFELKNQKQKSAVHHRRNKGKR